MNKEQGILNEEVNDPSSFPPNSLFNIPCSLFIILLCNVVISCYLCRVVMKKLIASFAVTIYFAFACGVIVNYHFCMDRFDSFSLYKTSGDWCGRCGMHIKKSHGCCHDEVKIVKIQDDHQTSSVAFQFKTVQPAITAVAEFIPAEINNGLVVYHQDHSPPLIHGQDTYLRNCVFRI